MNMYRCYKCQELIEEQSDAVPVQINGSPNKIYMHEHCANLWKSRFAEQLELAAHTPHRTH